MIVFVTAFVVMLLVIAAMAVGAIAGRKPIAGSCGGLGAVGIESTCACGRNPGTCGTNEGPSENIVNTSFYDASNK